MIYAILIMFSVAHGATHRAIPDAEVAEKLAFYKKIKTLKTQFHQLKNIKSIGMELKSDGELELVRPDLVIWTVKHPSFSKVELKLNKITIVSGLGAEQKTQTMNLGKEIDPNASKAILSLMAWMRMDIPEIQKSYSISDSGNGEFRCEPKDLTHSVFTALNFKLHSKGHVQELRIEEKSGDTMKIVFEKPTIQEFP